MPFTVADLKQKASSAKDASVNSFQNTKDRWSSTPSSKATWGPHSQQQPPSSPRTSTSSRKAPLPPPNRNTRPSDPPAVLTRQGAASHNGDGNHDSTIDWTNLSQEDKEMFFSWLDEFFARFFEDIGKSKRIAPVVERVEPQVVQRVLPTQAPQQSRRGPPPPIKKWSRPTVSSANPPANSSDDLIMSHPPSTKHGSAALDLAHYFKPSTHWDAPWYSSDNKLPPILQGSKHIRHSAAWQSLGRNHTLFGGVMFSDLSICWYTVEYTSPSSADPNDSAAVPRKARYLPRPSPLPKEALLEAHKTYGETIAAFAESFVGTGEVCGRGECWDLAHEAIKYLDNFDYVPKPVPSLSRTHGHLIFEGKATAKGRMTGRWRGEDVSVRRGDIVEWRKVKINIVGAQPGSWSTLGDPDHTAIIVRDSKPSRSPVDGQPLSPADIGSLEVVEQSVGSPPDRRTYDLNAFEQGEMWIYRPVSMQAYLGTSFEAQCPEGVDALGI